jgi:hypothetical protein
LIFNCYEGDEVGKFFRYDVAKVIFGFLRQDELPSGALCSAIPTLNGIQFGDIANILKMNHERAERANGWRLIRDELLDPDVCTSDRTLWDVEYTKSPHNRDRIVFSGFYPGKGLLRIFVDEYIFHHKEIEGKFSVIINTAKILKPSLKITFVVNNTILLYKGGDEFYTTTESDNNVNFIDLKEMALSNFYLNKKNVLSPLYFQSEDHKNEFLSAYKILRKFFKDAFEYDLYLTHGTLLGLIRSGDFVEHDDDFDCAYLSRFTDIVDVIAERGEIIKRIKQAKLRSSIGWTGHIKYKFNLVSIDVMPAWFDGDYYNVSSFTSIQMSREALLPFKEALFRGVSVIIPSDPVCFLLLNYGEGWRIPDPTYRSLRNSRSRMHFELFKTVQPTSGL